MQERIYYFLQTIPEGKVVSYKIIADKFGLHPRQVARILSRNHDIQKYPCYKVVNNNGMLGGYNLGIAEKIKRLEGDGIRIENDRVSKKYFWG